MAINLYDSYKIVFPMKTTGSINQNYSTIMDNTTSALNSVIEMKFSDVERLVYRTAMDHMDRHNREQMMNYSYGAEEALPAGIPTNLDWLDKRVNEICARGKL